MHVEPDRHREVDLRAAIAAVSLWNKYQFTPMWAASLGVIYFSDSFASSDDTVRLPGFVRVDAGLFATINEHWRAQLNIENIFNTGYWARPTATTTFRRARAERCG